MVKIQKISEIEPCLGFTEFDMLKKYRQSFATSELGRLHALFPFSELTRQMHLKSSALGRKSYFSPEGKIALMVLKSYTNFSDAQLIEHLNGNIHYQLFCGVQIDPLHPLTNPKIVSAIRQELADRLDVESLQLILAEHWTPYLENLHVCMTDATCYARNHRLVCLHEGYFSYWKSYLTSWSCFIHPTGTGLHYPLITKDVSRSYRQSLSKGRIYLQAKKCPTVS